MRSLISLLVAICLLCTSTCGIGCFSKQVRDDGHEPLVVLKVDVEDYIAEKSVNVVVKRLTVYESGDWMLETRRSAELPLCISSRGIMTDEFFLVLRNEIANGWIKNTQAEGAYYVFLLDDSHSKHPSSVLLALRASMEDR